MSGVVLENSKHNIEWGKFIATLDASLSFAIFANRF